MDQPPPDLPFQQVSCRRHGRQPAAFVCQHIAESLRSREPVGFLVADDPETPRPDAWCDQCEQAREADGGDWSDATLDHVGITLICGACYDEASELNP